jgi:hypothetical protein
MPRQRPRNNKRKIGATNNSLREDLWLNQIEQQKKSISGKITSIIKFIKEFYK